MLIPADRKELLAAIRKMVRAELDDSAQRHPAGRQILYTPVQAGAMLGVSRGSIDILVNSGLLRPRRWGRKTLIPHEQLVKVSKMSIPEFWPAKELDPFTGRYRTVRVAQRQAPGEIHGAGRVRQAS